MFGSGDFGGGITGDYYFFDKVLDQNAGLNWYAGAGGFLKTAIYSNPDSLTIAFGIRVPVGISLQPVPLLEVFFDIAPFLGFALNTDDNSLNGLKPGISFELGARFWF